MKKSLILVAALIACTVVFTLMTGFVQAQSLSPPSINIEEDEGKAEVPTEGDLAPAFVDPNLFLTGVCTIGPRGGDVLFRCFNLGFFFSPRLVSCQTRNNPSDFVNFPDQFACQIIGTTSQDNGSVWVRIRRLDAPGAGWGQNLQINLLVVR